MGRRLPCPSMHESHRTRPSLRVLVFLCAAGLTVSAVHGQRVATAAGNSAGNSAGNATASAAGNAAGNRSGAVTFTEHIAPIVFNNCTSGHRPGQVGPFSLTNYQQVRRRAKTIRRATEKRFMPPWHPVEGHGEFTDEDRLSKAEIELIGKWVDAGTPEGFAATAKAMFNVIAMSGDPGPTTEDVKDLCAAAAEAARAAGDGQLAKEVEMLCRGEESAPGSEL